MLSAILTMFGQDEPYSLPAERKAIETAYHILKLYYPLGDLSVSDSIYDQDWIFFENEMGRENWEDLYLNILYKAGLGKPDDETIYSSILSSMFGVDVCKSRRYVAEFTAPYRGMIRCDIVLSNDRNPHFGEIPVFLFKFNDKGEIYQFFQKKISLN